MAMLDPRFDILAPLPEDDPKLRSKPTKAVQQALADGQAAPKGSADWYRLGLDALDAPTDYTAQTAAQKRSAERAQRALLVAIAAGEAGPEFRALQGAALRGAEVDPLKVEGGFVDRDGNVVIDPGYQRTRKVENYFKRGDVAARDEAAAAARQEKLASTERENARDRALREALAANRPAGSEPLVTITGPDGNPVMVPRSQAAGQQPYIKPTPPKTLPAQVQKGFVENRAALAHVEDAIAQVKSNPSAFGFGNYLPEALTQRIDPKGVPARASVANLGSLKIHDRSGAAVTAAEFPRLLPFIPQATDTPEVAMKKLEGFRAELLRIEKEMTDFYGSGGMGYDIPGAARPPAAAAPGGQPPVRKFNPATGRLE